MAKAPEDPSLVPYVMTIFGIVLSLLSGATVYFLKRLIERNDKDHEGFSTNLSALKVAVVALENKKVDFSIGTPEDNKSLLETITRLEKMSEYLSKAFINGAKSNDANKEEIRRDFVALKTNISEIKKQLSDLDSKSVKLSTIVENNAIDKNKMVDLQKTQLENRLLMEKAHQLLRVFTEEVIKLKQKVK